jgi:inosose dehydratase
MNQSPSALPPDIHLGVSPLSWANDVLEDLGANIPLETCLNDDAEIGCQGVELGRKFPREAATLRPSRNPDLALASGWHSGELAERSVDAEIAAVAASGSAKRSTEPRNPSPPSSPASAAELPEGDMRTRW